MVLTTLASRLITDQYDSTRRHLPHQEEGNHTDHALPDWKSHAGAILPDG